ncbi:MAG: protein-disulfide reductase DsbD [Methylophilaceae bacterium]
MTKYLNLFLISIFLLCFSLTSTAANNNFSFYKQEEKFLPVHDAFLINLSLSDNPKEILLNFESKPSYYLYKSKIKFNASPDLKFKINLPKGKIKKDPYFGKQEVYYGKGKAIIQMTSLPQKEHQFTIEFQGCSEKGLCYPPTIKTFNYSLLKNKNQNNLSETDILVSQLSSQSLFLTLIGFFISGLLLSLTPCVLPMLPILSSIILASTPKKSIPYTLSYVAGISVTYSTLGVIAGLTGTLLSSSLQNINFIILSGIIYLIFAFAMFDFIQINLPTSLLNTFNKLLNNFKKNSAINIFFLGLFSSLILSPCVAPPLAAAILFIGQTQDLMLGGIALFSMSIGMSIPLLILGFSSQKILPKPGPWMKKVKYLLGFILIGMSIYILRPLMSEILFFTLLYILLIFTFVYFLLSSNQPTIRYKSFLIFGLILSVLSAAYNLKPFWLQGENGTYLTQAKPAFIQINNLNELNFHLTNLNNKPIILDFFADWCVACLEYEKFTFRNKEVLTLMNNFVLLRADVTANNDGHSTLLKQYGLFGPPGIIFFDTTGKEIKHLRTIGFKSATEFSLILKRTIQTEN